MEIPMQVRQALPRPRPTTYRQRMARREAYQIVMASFTLLFLMVFGGCLMGLMVATYRDAPTTSMEVATWMLGAVVSFLLGLAASTEL